MSLLASVNSGAASKPYFAQDVGATSVAIKADALGVVHIGNDVTGLILQSNNATTQTICGGAVNGSSLRLGGSQASALSLVFTDTAISAILPIVTSQPIILSGAAPLSVGGNITVGGNLVLGNGQTTGASISGYYGATVAVAGGGAFANPAGLTEGVYFVAYVPTSGGEQQQVSAMCVWTGAAWQGSGVSFAFAGGVPTAALCPVVGGATLQLGGAAPVAGSVLFRKMLN